MYRYKVGLCLTVEWLGELVRNEKVQGAAMYSGWGC
jgi:hypothetical protein